MVLPAGRGSSSASSILLEAVRLGTGPAGIITASADGILALGAVVAQEIYERAPAVVVLTLASYAELGHWLATGHSRLHITALGQVQLQ